MFRRISAFVFSGWLIACGTEPIQQPPPGADGGVETPDGGGMLPDGGGPPVDPGQNVFIEGYTYRLDAYLDGNPVPAGEATISALGTVGVQPVSSGALGDYRIEVPQNGALLLTSNKTGYWPTYEQLAIGNQNITGKNFLLAYNTHISLIADRLGIQGVDQEFQCHAPNQNAMCKYGIVMGRVVDDGSYDNGTPTPLAGVQKNEFTVTVDNTPGWYFKGPYFFFFNGQPDPNATATKRTRNMTTGKYEGGLFALFIEIPLVGGNSHDLELKASSLAEGTVQRYFGPLQIKVFRGGFTWVTLREGGVAPPPPPPPPGEVDFETQVYPLFLPVNQGGFGCQGCHTDQGGLAPAGGMNLYGGAAQAYTALDPTRYPQRVNVQNVSASLLLTKPLYEADGNQNHPIFAFASTQEPAYKTIYDWISAGAQYNGQVQVTPVSFYNEIRTLLYRSRAEGGIGCYDCHVSGVDANTAPGGAYFGGDGNALYQVLTQDPPSDDGNTGEPYRINKQGNVAASLVLTNPLVGSPEPHTGKIIPNANDVNYQKIYRWISEGYVNDTP